MKVNDPQCNIEVPAGDTATYTITIYESDGTTPQDLTGCTVYFIAKEELTDTDDDAIISTTATLTDADGGIASVTLAKADTIDMEDTLLWYSVVVVTTSGQRITAIRARMRVYASVLKDN